MANESSTSSSRMRFPEIGPQAYEHPTDRAALVALRKVKGFELVLRRLFGAVPERRLRLLYLANGVRVGPNQLPQLDRLLDEACEILDVAKKPELYVVGDPRVNAMAVGLDAPFIVVNSSLLQLMDPDELLCMIGHEVGHILSGHALYKTMLLLLQAMVRWILRGPLLLPALPVLLALKEWDRKSELSADRAGLLVSQDLEVTRRVMIKLAGGSGREEFSLDEFERQAAEYRESGGVVDQLFKVLNLLEVSHPFPVLRVVELGRWAASEEYERILAGEYPRRSERPEDEDLMARAAEAVQGYRAGLEENEALSGLLRGMASAGRSVWSQLFGEAEGNEEGGGGGPRRGPERDDGPGA